MRCCWITVVGLLVAIGPAELSGQDRGWGEFEKSAWATRGNKVLVVTDADPAVRQLCRIRAVEADRIVCAERHGHSRRQFRAQDLRAVIAPAYHENLLRYWLTGAVPGTALIVAGAILSGPWAVAAIVVGSLVVYCATFAVAFDTGDYPETVVYFKPGKALP